MSTDKLANTLVTLHEILMDLTNYPLLLGRVHTYHHLILTQLPQDLSAGQRGQLLRVWRTYAALATELYSLRQQLIHRQTNDSRPL